MPTIKEIAKACNVSVATVSNIINHKGSVGDATRERVEQVIREMILLMELQNTARKKITRSSL